MQRIWLDDRIDTNLISDAKRVQWKKKLGLRDESIYRDGAAGDGSNIRHKRQG